MIEAPPMGTLLPNIGNVPRDYTHEWREAEPATPLVLPNAVFKWYHLHRRDVPVPTALDAEARAVVTAAVAEGDFDAGYGLNFAVLHASALVAYLIIGVWMAHQELWEKLYIKEMAADGPFVRQQRVGEDAPTLCVWELGVVGHEREAWHRYLFSPRAAADKRAYLADTLAGRV